MSTWSEVLEELHHFPNGWVFRGQRDASWPVRCNLDRKRGTTEPVNGERLVLSEFKRRAHLYLPNGREPDNQLEWLSLIQHHGGPTRLIDFSYSPQLAAFFALEEHVDEELPEAMCAVLGLDEIALNVRAVKRLRAIDPKLAWLKEHYDIQEPVEARIGALSPQRFVASIRPYRQNSRLALQQGLFLFLGDPGVDLFRNLSPDVEGEHPLQLVRLEFPRGLRAEALQSLAGWGINRETLFPGLDGLAQSLGHALVRPYSNKKALIDLLLRPSGWPGTSDPPGKS